MRGHNPSPKAASERPSPYRRRAHTVPVALSGLGALAVAISLAAAGPAQGQARASEQDRFLERCGGHAATGAHGEQSRLSDECIPLAEMPGRPRPLLELGEPFLGTGTLAKGIRLPGGAVWQPALLAFGTLRTATQAGRLNSGDTEIGEAVGRLDFFGNLYLTQTERILVGLRPLDRDGRFTGYTFRNRSGGELLGEEEFKSELNGVIRTLFFEGDLGELLPNLDDDDSAGLDIYFSVGRQPLDFQDGLLLNEDALDMVGLTRANMKVGSVVNTRVTAIFAWGEVNRHSRAGNPRDGSASLLGLFSEMDLRASTVQFDAAYVFGSDTTGSGIYAGLGDIRRIGRANNTFRVLASFPVGDETPFNSQGFLIHNQFSWTPHRNHNFWYVGTFVGIERFRSAARGPSAGGALGQTGILYASPGIGRLGAPLGNQADNTAGGSLGYQMFFSSTRQQLLLEIGGAVPTKADEPIRERAGFGARYQAAIGRRVVFLLDGAGTYNFETSKSNAFGRLELSLQL